MKICKECKTQRELNEFYPHPQMADGHLNICKECKKSYARSKWTPKENAFTDRKRERGELNKVGKGRCVECKEIKGIIEFNKDNRERAKYGITEKCKQCRYNEIKSHGVRQRTRKQSEKTRARDMVNNRLRRGKMQKGECSYPNGACGGGIQAHHWDYSKALEVVWFCRKHHQLANNVQKVGNAHGVVFTT